MLLVCVWMCPLQHMEGSSAGIGMASMGMEGAHEDDRPPVRRCTHTHTRAHTHTLQRSTLLTAEEGGACSWCTVMKCLTSIGLHGAAEGLLFGSVCTVLCVMQTKEELTARLNAQDPNAEVCASYATHASERT